MRMRPTSRPRPAAALVAGGCLALVLAGCGLGGTTAEPPASQPVEGGAELAALWPLTGREVDDGGTPDRPVMVVKVDNSSSSRPQVGLGEADLVTEELVEGGSTRLAALYFEQVPDRVGPVRSMRATDIGIVKPAHGVVVASGGAPGTLDRLRRADIPFRVENQGPGWSRDSGRAAPYNLFVDLAAAADDVADLARVPASYLPWGPADDDLRDAAGARPARSFSAVFSPEHTTSWTYDGSTYTRETEYAAPGDRFRPDSVLVLRVRQGDAGYLDPAGNAVPETLYEGRGTAVLFHDGVALEATWSKSSRSEPLQLATRNATLRVPAGHVWVELLPQDGDGGRLVVG